MGGRWRGRGAGGAAGSEGIAAADTVTSGPACSCLPTVCIFAVIRVKLKTGRNYASLQPPRSSLTRSQMGSPPGGEAARARRKRCQQRKAK